LDIRLNDNAQSQSTLFTVTPSGFLEHPMLAEPLQAAGLTVEEISSKFESELKRRALVDNPKVSVGVRDYASHTILVSGLVKDSGTKILRREAIPLYVVVADAQPLPEAARVTVLRNESGETFEIDLTQAGEMNLLVRSGDVITLVPNVTQFVYIGGEVKLPGEKTFRRGLTLTQAIISAGGVTPKAKEARLGRDDGNGFLTVTRFKLKDIESGKIADPVVKPGDRITIRD
jgi:polysaccharide export outer membrane protein